jgi:hypothetical protein
MVDDERDTPSLGPATDRSRDDAHRQDERHQFGHFLRHVIDPGFQSVNMTRIKAVAETVGVEKIILSRTVGFGDVTADVEQSTHDAQQIVGNFP